jgi:integrase
MGHVSFDTVVDAFLASERFKKLRPNTQATWRRYLIFACRHIGKQPIESMSEVIDEFFEGLSSRPGIAHVTLSAIRQVEKFAKKRRYIAQPFTWDIELEKSGEGHTPWTDEQVRFGLTKTRLPWPRVIALGAYTGQRGSDLVRLGWNDIELFEGREGFALTQVKTGRPLWVPIVKELAQIMATWERQPGPFILRHDGKPWTRADLSIAWYRELERHDELAPLRELVLHGLRGHACVRLYRAGWTQREVAQFVGMSQPMVERYCRQSVQREDVMAAVIRLEGRNVLGTKLVTNRES